jgi:hypothetical protein
MVIFSKHALERMRQRGLLPLHVEQVLRHPVSIRRSGTVRMAEGIVDGRQIRVVFIRQETYIKIVTVI